MAFARDVYTAVAAQTDFTISFAYIDETHVTVYKDGVLQTSGAGNDYTIVSTTIVRFNSGLTGGETVVLQRATSQTVRLVDYATASTLTEEDLDNDSLQAFYMSQESIDIANTAIVLDGSDQWDFQNKASTNVPTPTAGDAVASKDYVDSIMAAAGNVPNPDDPGDDNYVLKASGGTYTWAAFDAHLSAVVQAILADTTAADIRTELGLGTAATQNVGVANTNVPQMDSVGYPAADGSRIVLAAIPGFIDGLILTQDTDTDHDIQFGVGVCTNGDGDEMLQNSTVMTKQLDATWASGDDAGGLSSSLTAPANDTWYHCFIGKVSGNVDFGFDTSVTGANLAADHSFTDLRRIGSILTNGSANIITFKQIGDQFFWDDDVLDQSAAPNVTPTTFTCTVPTGIKCRPMLYWRGTSPIAGYSVTVWGEGMSQPTGPNMWTPTTGGVGAINDMWTDTSANLNIVGAQATASAAIYTIGWFDPRGRTVE